MARTAAARREGDLRFHIVLRRGLALSILSPEPEMQRLALGCIAHEAAHVEHESHLYRMFPDSYGKPLECGNRSRQSFLKAMDVWSEYAACRFSATSKIVGVGPIEYLQQWRIALAKDELRRGTSSVGEIALAIRFLSGSAFSTAFTRTVGCSPRHFMGKD